jgi:hypothetical protein
MANQWGNNTLGPGQNAGWYFIREAVDNDLAVLSIRPLSPSLNNDGTYYFTQFDDGISVPVMKQIGSLQIWVQLSDDEQSLVYQMQVFNYSDNTISYSFLESHL